MSFFHGIFSRVDSVFFLLLEWGYLEIGGSVMISIDVKHYEAKIRDLSDLRIERLFSR